MNIKNKKMSIEATGSLTNHKADFMGPSDNWKVRSILKLDDIKTENIIVELSFREAKNFKLIWYANRCDRCHENRENQETCPTCGINLTGTTEQPVDVKIKLDLEIREINP